MTRVKVATSHALLSVIIFSSIFFVLISLWYPPPYFTAAGGWEGLKIAAMVDLVLGPLLTFIIFDTKKARKKIILDLSFIIMLQISALIFGISVIYQQRPVASVFWDGSFYVVPMAAFKDQSFALQKINELSDEIPALIYAKKPEKLEELKPMLDKIKNNNIPPHHQLDLYHPLKNFFTELVTYQLNIIKVMEKHKQVRNSMELFLSNNRTKKINDFVYFPLQAKYHNIILIFSTSGEFIDFISVSTLDEK